MSATEFKLGEALALLAVRRNSPTSPVGGSRRLPEHQLSRPVEGITAVEELATTKAVSAFGTDDVTVALDPRTLSPYEIGAPATVLGAHIDVLVRDPNADASAGRGLYNHIEFRFGATQIWELSDLIAAVPSA